MSAVLGRSTDPVVGQRMEIEGRFYLKGAPTDPVIVRCLVRSPHGEMITLTYPDEELERRELGWYEASVIVDAPGTWAARFEGAGTVDAVQETTFNVTASSVVQAM